MSRKSNSDCVTRLECATVSSEIKRDLSAIKTALIGADMQGGIVNKINDIESKVVELALKGDTREKANNKRDDNAREQEKVKIEAWSREKVALIGTIGAIVGFIVNHLLSAL